MHNKIKLDVVKVGLSQMLSSLGLGCARSAEAYIDQANHALVMSLVAYLAAKKHEEHEWERLTWRQRLTGWMKRSTSLTKMCPHLQTDPTRNHLEFLIHE